MSVAIVGAGAFGTALAVALADRAPVLVARDLTALSATRESPRLPGVRLPESVGLADSLPAAETVMLALPAQVLRGWLADHAAALSGRALVACGKGIDLTTLQGPTALIAQAVPDAVPAILTGPSFAGEIARGLPTALTLACADEARALRLQHDLSAAALRLYRTTDVVGAELGGALKNVVAIGCGAVMGAGLGHSARAALMTRGFAEMRRIATALGAREETLAGLSGFGDLVLTCTSDQSRNYRFGAALGRDEAPDPSMTVEGAPTARAAARLGERLGIDLPVTATVAALADREISVQEAMQRLLARPLKEE